MLRTSLGGIDAFDINFLPATDLAAGAFTDPGLPAGYGPFNVMTFGTEVLVAYVQVDPKEGEEVGRPGLGLVDAFDFNGTFLRRVATGGTLNAPWGMAVAPASFGTNAGMLLVGNFGDGRISAFDLATGEPHGQLADKAGATIVVDGLWGITFGDGDEAGRADVLYFAAGPDDEEHGLYGRIQATGVCSGATY